MLLVPAALAQEVHVDDACVVDTLDVTGALGPCALRVARAIPLRRVGACQAGG